MIYMTLWGKSVTKMVLLLNIQLKILNFRTIHDVNTHVLLDMCTILSYLMAVFNTNSFGLFCKQLGVYISWHEIERTPPLSFFLPFLFPRKKRTKKNSCWLCHWWFLTESICSIWFDPTPKNVIKWARKVKFPIDDGWNIKLSKSYKWGTKGQKMFTVVVDMRAFCSSFYTLLRQ